MAYDSGLASGLAARELAALELAAGYVTLGTRDLARARRFYEVIAREIGVRQSVESDHVLAWGLPGEGLAVSDHAPMRAQGLAPLQAEDPEQVRRLYEIALLNGGMGEGEPQDLGGFFAAYFRDPDGNRLNAFCVTQH